MVGHDEVRAFVLLARQEVAQLEQGLQHGELRPAAGWLVSLDCHVEVEVLHDVLLPGFQAQRVALVHAGQKQVQLVLWLLFGPLLNELFAQDVIDVEQVVGILPCVLQHLSWQWSYSPVSKLVLLISKNATVGLEKKGQTKLLQLQNPSGLTSVKHVHDINSKVALEPLDIHV